MTPKTKRDLLPGMLDMLILKSLSIQPMHGYGIAQHIESIARNTLSLNQGTLYPALLRLEQRNWIKSKWGKSENNRRARYYTLTPSGRRQLQDEAENWERVSTIVQRLLSAPGNT